MHVPTALVPLTGHWLGANRLWLSPDDPAYTSGASAVVTWLAQGRFLSMRYTWTHRGEAQDGLLLVGVAGADGAVDAVWIDSWHMQAAMMHCTGRMDGNGGITLEGAYAAPPGPDWGWRIELAYRPDDSLQMRMYNIPPGGDAAPAVEALYTHKP